MNTKNMLRLVSVIIFTTSIVITALLAPMSAWTPVSSTSALLLAFFLAGIFWATIAPSSSSGDDAVVLASVGPSVIFFAVLVPWGAASLCVAFIGPTSIAWIMNALAICGFAVAVILLKVTSGVIKRVATLYVGSSARTDWIIKLEVISDSTSNSLFKQRIIKLADSLRYAASATPGSKEEHGKAIAEQLSTLEREIAIQDGDGELCIQTLERLFFQREAELKRLRSKN